MTAARRRSNGWLWGAVVAVLIFACLMIMSFHGATQARCEDAVYEIEAFNLCTVTGPPTCVTTPDDMERIARARDTVTINCQKEEP